MKRRIKAGYKEQFDEWYYLVERGGEELTFRYGILDDEDKEVNIFKRLVDAQREFDILTDWQV